MPTTRELTQAGELQAAIQQLTSEVKVNPTDVQRRTFLFELLCFAGEWDRAERQLDVIGQQSAKTEVGVQVYRNNIKAERDRSRLFSDGLAPHFLLEPPAYVDLHLNAVNRLREGNTAEARQTLDRAEEERPAMTGKIDGEPFLDLRDYNDLIGPVLELIVRDKYTWLPFQQIEAIEIKPPLQLRHLMWAEARIQTTDGTVGEMFIPTLYEGTCNHKSDQVKLGRMTEWEKIGEELSRPYGLRLFLIDDEDKAMLEVRNIQFDHTGTQ